MNTRTFPASKSDFKSDRWHKRRYKISLQFLRRHISYGSAILDLGTVNGLSLIMAADGLEVINTDGRDLDLIEPHSYMEESEICPLDAVTAFEILEHLVCPYNLLTSIPSDRLIASVPLRLWFAKDYNASPKDRHFHEFEPWQFDWLLDKAGWKILDREYHTSPTFRLGFRSVLRWIYPRWYFVYAEREEYASQFRVEAGEKDEVTATCDVCGKRPATLYITPAGKFCREHI